MQSLDTQVEKITAHSLVKQALTIPPALAGMTRHSMVVDRLLYQIEEAVTECFDQMARQNLGDKSEYGKAIIMLV